MTAIKGKVVMDAEWTRPWANAMSDQSGSSCALLEVAAPVMYDEDEDEEEFLEDEFAGDEEFADEEDEDFLEEEEEGVEEAEDFDEDEEDL